MAFWYDTWSVNCLGVSKKNTIMVLGKRQRQPGGLKIQPVGLDKYLEGLIGTWDGLIGNSNVPPVDMLPTNIQQQSA